MYEECFLEFYNKNVSCLLHSFKNIFHLNIFAYMAYHLEHYFFMLGHKTALYCQITHNMNQTRKCVSVS